VNTNRLGIAQLFPAAARSLLAAGAALAATLAPVRAGEKVVIPISQVSAVPQGQFVTVQGEIAEERAFKAGMRYLLRDEGASVTLVLFDRALKQSPGIDRLLPGALVRVTGKVDTYRDERQIVPVRGSDVRILRPAPPVPSARIGDLTPADDGRLVVLSGQLVGADSFSAGFKFQLDDGSGRIALTVFENVYDGLARPEQVNLGARVSVTGVLSLYKTALEVVPAAGARLQVLSPPVRQAEQRALASISDRDHGALVRVAASVVRLDKRGEEALIKDDTGVQKLRLKGAVAKRVALKPNDSIEAIGKVHFSPKQGTVIDVVLPTDIKILR
jgi:DNA/RNA endonuclease YhcR with UshA esterase domain